MFKVIFFRASTITTHSCPHWFVLYWLKKDNYSNFIPNQLLFLCSIGEKPYKCPFCERRFKQQSHVKQHSRLHTGILKLKSWFGNNQQYDWFFFLFSGERPYKCSEPSCGRSFVQLSNLQQHMSNHSKEDVGKVKDVNFQCPICGKIFRWTTSLKMAKYTLTLSYLSANRKGVCYSIISLPPSRKKASGNAFRRWGQQASKTETLCLWHMQQKLYNRISITNSFVQGKLISLRFASRGKRTMN